MNIRCTFGLLMVAALWALGAPAQGAIKVFLLGGQSNMVGLAPSADLPEALAQPRADIPIYWGGGWRSLQPGYGSGTNTFGPEISFGPAMKQALAGQDIALVKFAVGGTNLAEQWRPPSSPIRSGRPGGRGEGVAFGGTLYEQFRATVLAAIASIENLGLGADYEIAGMIWMQGESDSQNPTMAEFYEQNLTNLITDLRAALAAPDMAFVIAQISQAETWTHRAIVRQAQLDVAAALEHVTVFDTADLSLLPDTIHYDAQGTIDMGERFAQSMLTLIPAPGSLIFLVAGWGVVSRRKRRAPLRRNPLRARLVSRAPIRREPERRWRRLAELG